MLALETSDDMTSKSMKPIEKKSLAEEVAQVIKHRIKSGYLALNAQLPSEPELMKTFAVGRSSIREAIKILAQSGFLKVQQGLGTFVISTVGNDELSDKIDNANFAEVFEVRQLLELKIIEKSALNRTEKQLIVLRQKLDERHLYAVQGKLQECIKVDINFHTVIAESCGNTILSALYKTLSEHVERFFYDFYKDTAPFIESQQLHEELFQHISNKDAVKALSTAKNIIGHL